MKAFQWMVIGLVGGLIAQQQGADGEVPSGSKIKVLVENLVEVE